MANSDFRKVGALWRKTGKSGKTFYSGKLDAAAMKSALVGDETTLMLFPVRDKRGKGPDVELFCVPSRPREEPMSTATERAEFDDSDDIPF